MKRIQSVQHFFNLVEILLALGVVAVGLCSVMVLFPIGANANRDASIETYAANAADQILRVAKFRLDTNTAYWTSLISADGTNGLTFGNSGIYNPNSDLNFVDSATETAPKLSGTNVELPTGYFDDTTHWPTNNTNTSLVNANDLKTPIFTASDHPYLLQIAITEVDEDDSKTMTLSDLLTSENLNYRAGCLLWASKIDINGTELPLSMGARLNLKLFWPLELPASARKSATYSLDVYKK